MDNSPKKDNGKKLIENRCSCGRLMFKSRGLLGEIELKCQCGNVNTIRIQPEGRPFQERLGLAKK